MTETHPLTPPDELVGQWTALANKEEGCKVRSAIATQAAQWGADQELEACCEWFIGDWTDIETADKLRAARRPKPPSLKEQALLVIDTAVNDYRMSSDAASIIRRALEALND